MRIELFVLFISSKEYCRRDFGMKSKKPSRLNSYKDKYIGMRCYNIWIESVCNDKKGSHICIYTTPLVNEVV